MTAFDSIIVFVMFILSGLSLFLVEVNYGFELYKRIRRFYRRIKKEGK